MTPLTMSKAARTKLPIQPRQPVGLASGVLLPEAAGSPGALPHESFAFAAAKVQGNAVELRLGNSGPQALQLAVHCYHRSDPRPERHDLMPGQSISVEIPTTAGIYDIAVHGPNGFLRTIAGDMASTLAGFDASLTINGPANSPALLVELRNADRITRMLKVASRVGAAESYRLAPDSSQKMLLRPLQRDTGWRAGWYDLTVTVDGVSSFSRRFAGHLSKARPFPVG
jgi:phospholipase C